MARHLTEKQKEQVRALMRRVPREGSGEWLMPTAASVALERELSGATQQARERIVKWVEANQPTDQGGPTTMAKFNTGKLTAMVSRIEKNNSGRKVVQRKPVQRATKVATKRGYPIDPIRGKNFRVKQEVARRPQEDDGYRTKVVDRLIKLQAAGKVTLQDMADACGIKPQSVHVWMKKGALPTSDKVAKLERLISRIR